MNGNGNGNEDGDGSRLRNRRRLPALRTVLLSTCLLGCSALAEDWRFPAADRVVAIADVHGAYEAFVETLAVAEVVDGQGRWSGGRTRLVVVGDVLDRGARSRAAMDLIRRLETEAAAAGGAVHLTLGNHEVMNLVGDLRYVSREEYAAFAGEETAAERTAALARFRNARPGRDPEVLKVEFEEAFPTGYFAHRRAFAADGEYGRWLLGKPALVVIGDTAFVHGGLPPAVARHGGEVINTEARDITSRYTQERASLLKAGVLPESAGFYDDPVLLAGFAEQVDQGLASWSDEMAAAARQLIELNGARVFNPDGVLWYRGTAGCPAAIEEARLDASLAKLGATRVIIGHTPNPQGVRSRINAKVVRLDTGMLSEVYRGVGSAWILEGQRVRVRYQDGRESLLLAEVAGAPTALALDRASLEEALRTAELAPRESDLLTDENTRIAHVAGRQLVVEFIPPDRPGGNFLPEVAAYRLDRALGLDMVPITVVREESGERGSLRLIAYRMVTEAQRQEQREGAGAWCPLQDQFSAMYVFDALLGNTRLPDAMSYVPGSWALVLMGHAEAFGTSRSIPAHLKPPLADLSPAWQARLAGLNEPQLQALLGDVLGDRRIAAILKRRDRLR